MAGKRLLTAIKPPKPTDHMAAAEKARFVDEVVTQIAAATKTADGK